MNSDWRESWIVSVIAVPLFAASGCLTSVGRVLIALGLPFGVLSASLYAPGLVRFALVIIVDMLAWAIAFLMVVLSQRLNSVYLSFFLAGAAGGIGVTGANALCHTRFRSSVVFLVSGLLGGLAALTFKPWFDKFELMPDAPDPAQRVRLMLGFVTWQVVMGAYSLYIARRRAPSASLPTFPL